MIFMAHQLGSSKKNGFTLIEALVALVVLSIALLGIAAMQLQALKSSGEAYQRSLASLIAVDVQERVWAASAEVLGECDAVLSGDFISVVNGVWGGGGDHDGEYAGQETLPGLSIAVTQSSCVFEVDLSWGGGRFFGEDDENVFSYSFMLPGND